MNSGAKKKYVCPENGWFGIGAASDHRRRRRHQQPEQQRARVAHEDPRRVEVVGQEAEADAEHDDGHERADVGLRQQPELVEALAVEEERAGRDGDDAGGETVEAVDEVDGVGQPDEPQHRHERSQVLADRHHVEERDPEVEHRDAEVGEHGAGHHHAGHLGRRRDAFGGAVVGRRFLQVVGQAHREHHDGAEHHARAARSC